MCGLIGVMNQTRLAAPDLYVGPWAQQHRGKESAALVCPMGGALVREGGLGEVPQAFAGKSLDRFDGTHGIAHCRYSTAGVGDLRNLQPVAGGNFFLAHNGNLVNVRELRGTTASPDWASDTQVIADLFSHVGGVSFADTFVRVLEKLQGAFCLLAIKGDLILAARDQWGLHPLQLGRRQNQDGSTDHLIASESCAFDHLGAQLVRDISPGELIVLTKDGLTSYEWSRPTTLKIDLFEYIYFLRPDSVVHGVEAGAARYWMGRFLSQECPIEADLVMSVPDSGNEAALGYYEGLLTQGLGISFRPWATFRPHGVSRTFIEPVQAKRLEYLRLKFNPRPSQIAGKHVILVDDSIVRGNTLEVLTDLLWRAGARQISAVISSPPYIYPDFYGIDSYRVTNELIMRVLNGDVRALRDRYHLAHLHYLSCESTIAAVLKARNQWSDLAPESFYTGPFTGEYPAGKGDFG